MPYPPVPVDGHQKYRLPFDRDSWRHLPNLTYLENVSLKCILKALKFTFFIRIRYSVMRNFSLLIIESEKLTMHNPRRCRNSIENQFPSSGISSSITIYILSVYPFGIVNAKKCFQQRIRPRYVNAFLPCRMNARFEIFPC